MARGTKRTTTRMPRRPARPVDDNAQAGSRSKKGTRLADATVTKRGGKRGSGRTVKRDTSRKGRR